MAVVDVELLGRPGIRISGERVELKGRQPALLGALAIAAPRPVAADTLAEVVWGADEDLPADPANALQQRISGLRQALDRERTGQILVTLPGAYALRIEDEHIDDRRFARLAAEGRELLVAADHTAARDRLVEALGLWYGQAFAGVADEPWAVAAAQRLQELRIAATEDRIDADLGLGAGSELVAELTELVAAEPLRERLCGQLMRALYRAGRQGEALVHYEQLRHRLADELGVDPSPQLQRIHLQVLDQADDLELAVLSTPRRVPSATNLPARTRPVIGRKAVIERVGQLLAAGRLVTLTGPGGAGKTTVAIEAARRQSPPADGIWLVELAALSEGGAVPDAVAAAVGIGAGLGGATIDGDVLLEALAERALLLVLDNCEHVVSHVAHLVERLLARAPGVRVLTTSREPLAVDGELVWSLPALGVPEPGAATVDDVLAAPAVELLVERIRAHDPTFVLDATGARAASAIARLLDGIPLAIELAAARSRVLALPELAAALDDRFAVLSSTRRDAPSRQRTLRGAIDWSWDLMGTEGRTAWAALAVPVGGADRAMAAALLDAAGVASAPLDVLEELVDRSVLSLDTSTAPPRYRMLESLRAYGQERLHELDLDTPVRAQHASVVADALDRCHEDADPAAFGVDLDGLSSWLDEARAALHWASRAGQQQQLMQRIAGRLGWLWLLRGLATEGLRWLDEALGAIDGAQPEGLDPNEVDADALLWASGLRATGADPRASAWAAQSVAAGFGQARGILAQVFAAVHRAHAGDVDAALRDLTDAVDHARVLGGWPLGFAHVITAQIGRIAGRIDAVREHAQTALTLLTDAGVDWARAQAIDIVVDAMDLAAEPARARRLAAEGLELCRQRGFPELEGRMLLQLGVATHASGDTALARSYLEEAVELTARAGTGPSLGFALLVAGAHARERGELEGAREQLGRARELLARTAMPYGAARAALELGRTLVALGDTEQAGTLTSEAVRLARDVGDSDLLAQAEQLAVLTR